MSGDPTESDWKQFRKMVPELRERYLERVNADIAGILQSSDRNETECFWEAEEAFQKRKQILRDCFDDHRRSTLLAKIAVMHRNEILSAGDIEAFSEGVRGFVERLSNL